jgi:serine phosphatase RsbU (regulator of sigma subunit)
MRREMDLARRAQEKLIPKSAPPIPGLQAVGWTLPASATGGDCFDLWQLADGRLGILLADASGHGLAPAMMVGQVRSLVRAMSNVFPDPHAVLDRINARMIEDLETGQFVTAFLGFLGADGTLHWASAGQGPTLIRPDPLSELRSIDPPLPPLGVDPWPQQNAAQSATIEPGGSLILVSDGLFESLNPASELFGIDRMIETLNHLKSAAPDAALASLRQAAHDWQAGRDPLDDETIVMVQRG